jgi:stage IV sporulation protein FB
MDWSVRVFRLFGITVRLHWTLPVFLLYLVVSHFAHYGTPSLGYAAALAGCTFLLVLLHEFGHCAAARRAGLSADDIVLWPLGGVATVGGSGSPATEVGVAAAGPAVNLVVCGLLLGAMAAQGIPWDWQNLNVFAPHYAGRLLPDLFRISWMLFAFNLAMPAYPMDGGRILQGVLAMRLGMDRATYVAAGVAMGVAALMVAGGLVVQDVFLALIGIFIFAQAAATRRAMPEFGGGPAWNGGFESSDPARRRPQPGILASLRRGNEELRMRRRLEEEARLRERVDALLDKVSHGGGIGALTPGEREFLEEASRRFQEFDAQHKG